MEVVWLESNFQHIKSHLDRLCEEQHLFGMTTVRLAQNIQKGSHRVWVWGDFEAVFLTSLYHQQNGRLMCSLSWAVGENVISDKRVILEPIERYARDHECYGIEIMGRKGWERVTRDLGFRFMYQSVIKEL